MLAKKLKEFDAEIDSISAKIIETMRRPLSHEKRQEQLKELMARQDELNENKKKTARTTVMHKPRNA